jgi:hypothetical protein
MNGSDILNLICRREEDIYVEGCDNCKNLHFDQVIKNNYVYYINYAGKTITEEEYKKIGEKCKRCLRYYGELTDRHERI